MNLLYRHKPGLFVLALLGLLFAGQAAADQPALKLGLPIDCALGDDCWLVNLVDLDSSGGAKDHHCGNSTYDGHKGTDFAIRDLRQMALGVQVLASGEGVVAGIRDGMPDVSIADTGMEALAGRDCGNGVVIRHGDRWETQYCHMRQGSVRVSKGDRVAAGDVLGLVGLSGRTEFPHVHLSVRHEGRIIDPFTGLTPNEGGVGCGVDTTEGGRKSLWADTDVFASSDSLTAIYSLGFSGVSPNIKAIRAGLYEGVAVSADDPALVVWTDIFRVEKGDVISISLIAPDGSVMAQHSATPDRSMARHYLFAGKKRKTAKWPSGRYRGEVTVTRKSENGEPVTIRESKDLVIP